MKTDVEGIVLRETKTSYNRRMIQLFTREYGKISAGTSLGERGKTKSSLALQHFTFGRYILHRGRSGYNIDSAEVVKSFYSRGENIDKYLYGSYVLEFTGKVLEEEVPAPGLFDLLLELFEILEKRNRGIGTPVLAYQTRLLGYMGVAPVLDRCASCGRPAEGHWFGIAEGGLLCDCCKKELEKLTEAENNRCDSLIYSVDNVIINALDFFGRNSLRKLENTALNGETGRKLQQIIRDYAAYHLDASNIKSESMI